MYLVLLLLLQKQGLSYKLNLEYACFVLNLVSGIDMCLIIAVIYMIKILLAALIN